MSEIKENFTRISSISSAFANFHSIDPKVLKNAADRGERVHKIIFNIMSDLPVPSEMYDYNGQDLKPYLESWSQFFSPYLGSKMILQEERIDDEVSMLTGEPDLIIEHEGKIKMFDWKCSYAVGKHWKLQGSGYHYLASTANIEVDEICFVRLAKSGGPPGIVNYRPSWEQFFAAYDLYKEYLNECKCNLEDE